ncbi:MAG: hypothetical protein ACO31W_06580 [Gemmatimonadaceae bacterium]
MEARLVVAEAAEARGLRGADERGEGGSLPGAEVEHPLLRAMARPRADGIDIGHMIE